MAWLERNLEDYPVPTPLSWQGCPPPDQAAEGPIQCGLGHLQGWGTHSFLGSLCQCLIALDEINSLNLEEQLKASNYLNFHMW